jgi:hypothetical protein
VGLTVSTLIDESDGNYSDGDLSLREALAVVAANPGADIIEFSSSALAIGPATMTLAYDGADAGAVPDELSINSDVTIVGPGGELLTIDAAGQNRVFNVASGTSVTLQDVTITGGNNVNQGGGIYSYYANLTLDSVRITDNQTYLSGSVNGGGIYSYGGSLHMIDSTVDNNESRWGGGLYVNVDDNSDVLEIVGSTIYDNTALINGNDGLGGGLIVSTWASGAALSMVNSTVSGNSASHSGGIRVEGSAHLDVVNSTITDNDAVAGTGGAQGGGISLLD